MSEDALKLAAFAIINILVEDSEPFAVSEKYVEIAKTIGRELGMADLDYEAIVDEFIKELGM